MIPLFECNMPVSFDFAWLEKFQTRKEALLQKDYLINNKNTYHRIGEKNKT